MLCIRRPTSSKSSAGILKVGRHPPITFAAVVIFLILILLLCVFGVAHTYVIYPMWVVSRAGELEVSNSTTLADASWPPVAVLMAAHNEAAVLPGKLESLFAQDYPGPLRFFVGSDNSTDGTNRILMEAAERDERLHPFVYTTRQGKPGIVNQLARAAGKDGVYILTDASVMLRGDTITELVRPLRNDPRLGVVDATMIQTGGADCGVGAVETAYIEREVAVKQAEGQLWQAMIGPFGGCYALRAGAYRPVPDNYLVDDFFLCMSAYAQGYGGESSPVALVEERVGQRMGDEFRRKVRIGSGNWQNLVHFHKLWWPPWRSRLAFAFFSHKVLRWVTPLLMIVGAACWLAIALLTGNHWWWGSFALSGGGILGGSALDGILSEAGIHVRALRRLRYFLLMNVALLLGLVRYLTGIRTNVWQPSNRH